MAKTISSLNVVLGATVAPFVNAFKGAESSASSLVSSLQHVGSAMASLTGAGLALGAIRGMFDKVFAAPGEAIAAATRQADAETRLAAVLRATGGAAGFSMEQLKEHAAALQKTTTYGDEAIMEFQAVLATFRNVSGDAFTQATGLALDMSSVMGSDLQSTAVQLGKALNDPIEGITALRRVGVSFTQQQIAQITAMQQAGDAAGAQAVVLSELKNEFGGAAEAMAKTPFGKLKQIGNVIGDLSEQVGGVLATIGVGFAKAFDLDNVLEGVSAGLTRIQGAVDAFVTNFGEPIAASVKTVYGAVSGAFGAIYGVAVPVLSSIWGYADRIFGGIGNTAVVALAAVAAAVTAVSAVIAGPLVLAGIGAAGAILSLAGTALSTILPLVPAVALVASGIAAIGAAIGLDNIEAGLAAVGSAIMGLANYVIGQWNTIAAFTSSVWATIEGALVSAWNAIYGFVTPIVQTIGQVIAERWQSVWETTAGVFAAVYTVISDVIGAAWTVISAVGSGIARVWTWAMDVLGLNTMTAGQTTRSVFGGLVSVFQWLEQSVTLSLNVIDFGFRNLGTVMAAAGVASAYEVVKLGNVIAYTFTDVIPAYLKWFGQNWSRVLVDAFNFTTTIFGNIAANVYEVISNLPGLISGKVKFADIWTPLTSGFEATMSALPKIADRKAGGLEKSLGDQSATLNGALSKGFDAYLQEQQNKTKAITDAAKGLGKGLADAMKTTGKPVDSANPLADATKPPKLDTSGVTKPLKDVTASADQAKKSVQGLDAVISGSAESLKLQFEGKGLAAAKDAMPVPAPEAAAAKSWQSDAEAAMFGSAAPAAVASKGIDTSAQPAWIQGVLGNVQDTAGNRDFMDVLNGLQGPNADQYLNGTMGAQGVSLQPPEAAPVTAGQIQSAGGGPSDGSESGKLMAVVAAQYALLQQWFALDRGRPPAGTTAVVAM